MKFHELEDGREAVERVVESVLIKRALERQHRLLEIAPYILAALVVGFFVGLMFASSVAGHIK
jgi:hypothetical protein